MINIPVKVKDRLTTGVKKFQPILTKARDRDINESDTVVIINDVLTVRFLAMTSLTKLLPSYQSNIPSAI